MWSFWAQRFVVAYFVNHLNTPEPKAKLSEEIISLKFLNFPCSKFIVQYTCGRFWPSQIYSIFSAIFLKLVCRRRVAGWGVILPQPASRGIDTCGYILFPIRRWCMSTPLVPIQILSIYKKNGNRALLPSRMAKCAPDMLAAIRAAEKEVEQAGGNLYLSDLFRRYHPGWNLCGAWCQTPGKPFQPSLPLTQMVMAYRIPMTSLTIRCRGILFNNTSL